MNFKFIYLYFYNWFSVTVYNFSKRIIHIIYSLFMDFIVNKYSNKVFLLHEF